MACEARMQSSEFGCFELKCRGEGGRAGAERFRFCNLLFQEIGLALKQKRAAQGTLDGTLSSQGKECVSAPHGVRVTVTDLRGRK